MAANLTALQTLALRYATGKLPFPYKAQYMGDPLEKLDTLKSYAVPVSHEHVVPHNIHFRSKILPLNFRGGYHSFVHDESEYTRMDVLVDLFEEQERARLQARRKDTKESPWELWAKPGFVLRVLEKAMEKFGSVEPESVRETLFTETKECTQFKPTLAVAVMKLFGASHVLDISAGWGDRLVGAIAADVERYQAFDPNRSLRPGHKRIIETLVSPEKRDRFDIQYTGFEEAKLERESFDLIFTSPPFFDFEIYTSIPGQSIETYPTLEKWLAGFLCKSLRKAWDALSYEGYCVIHITDVYMTKVCEFMCLYVVSTCPDAVYEGVLCSTGAAGKPRPLWVFKKTKQATVTQIQQRTSAKKELPRNNPKAYQFLSD